MVIIDTTVWSLSLRRTKPDPAARGELGRLIREEQAVLLGPVRQEVLSGYSDPAAFERLRSRLEQFQNEPVFDEDYVTAASYHNACRREGIQGASVDFLICACAVRLEAPIFTRDRDFERYRDVLPITLHDA